MYIVTSVLSYDLQRLKTDNNLAYYKSSGKYRSKYFPNISTKHANISVATVIVSPCHSLVSPFLHCFRSIRCSTVKLLLDIQTNHKTCIICTIKHKRKDF